MVSARKNDLATTFLCVIAVVTACGKNEESGSIARAKDEPIRVVDDLGREIALRKPAARIAALSPGFVESLFAIGCGDAVILRDTWSDFPRPAVEGISAVDGVQISARAVAGFAPDLVLLFADDARFSSEFERIHVPVAVLHPDTYSEVVEDIGKLGVLCGREAESRRVIASMLAARDEVARHSDAAFRPSVYIEIDATDPTRPWAAGKGSFMDELIAIAGGRNALDGLPSAFAQVSAEAVMRADPDVVLVAHAGIAGRDAAQELLGRPGWASLEAVKGHRVVSDIDGDLLSRPGPRLADGLRALGDALRRLSPVDGGTP